MCYRKPGLRCSPHMRTKLMSKVVASINKGGTPAARIRYKKEANEAIQEWYSSPEGLEAINPDTPTAYVPVIDPDTGEEILDSKGEPLKLVIKKSAKTYRDKKAERDAALSQYKRMKDRADLSNGIEKGERGRPQLPDGMKRSERLKFLLTPAENAELAREAAEMSEATGRKTTPSELVRDRITDFLGDPKSKFSFREVVEVEKQLRETHAMGMAPDERGEYLHEQGVIRFARKSYEGKVVYGRRPTYFPEDGGADTPSDSYKRGEGEGKKMTAIMTRSQRRQLAIYAARLNVSESDLISRIAGNRPLFEVNQHMSIDSMMRHAQGAKTLSEDWESLPSKTKAEHWIEGAKFLHQNRQGKVWKSYEQAARNDQVVITRVNVQGSHPTIRSKDVEVLSREEAQERVANIRKESNYKPASASESDAGTNLVHFDKAGNVYLIDVNDHSSWGSDDDLIKHYHNGGLKLAKWMYSDKYKRASEKEDYTEAA